MESNEVAASMRRAASLMEGLPAKTRRMGTGQQLAQGLAEEATLQEVVGILDEAKRHVSWRLAAFETALEQTSRRG